MKTELFGADSIRTPFNTNRFPSFNALLLVTSLVISSLFCSMQTSAAVLFSDDFARANSNEAGGLWNENEADSNDIAIYNDRLRLRDYLATGYTQASFILDTTGFSDLSLDLDWQVLSSTEGSDTLNFGLAGEFASPSWTTGLANNGLYSTTIDISSFDNSGLQEFAFWIDVNSRSESLYLNSVTINGSAVLPSTPTLPPAITPPPPSTPTPPTSVAVAEPSTTALLGLGLIGLMYSRRKSVSIQANG